MAVNYCWQLTADGAVNRRSDRWLVDAVSTRLPMAATVTNNPWLWQLDGYFSLFHVIFYKEDPQQYTWSPGVLCCGDILPLTENSIFYTFCIFSWPQIANGGIDVDHISHGDDHFNGSSTRAHNVAPPATWHVPEGVKHFRWPNFGKCLPNRTKLGSVMHVNTPDITAPYLSQCATFVAKRHFRHHAPFWPQLRLSKPDTALNLNLRIRSAPKSAAPGL